MVSQTNEQALEAAIEKYLTGACLEELGNIGDGGLAGLVALVLVVTWWKKK